ncbi:MAG: endonuclease [Flavobacteriaceae bacterium]|nr:endonuclease [Flavobacteriaceae bacterium]
MYRKTFLILSLLCIAFSYGQQAYYNDVNLNLTGLTLKEELASKVTTTHTKFLFYSEIWDASKITDVNPQNNQEVLLIYGWENGTDFDDTNDRTRGLNNNGGNVGEWNREHVYSRSLGTPNLGYQGPGADAHHLRPSDVQRNSSRNNKKFTAGSGNSGIQGNGGWYPGDEWKGDVARMMMYMYIRYNDRCLPTNVGFGSDANTPDEMIDLFLQWNAEDPVSQIEIQRNNYHGDTNNDYAQGNRNPFIDNPRLATRIWGGPEAEDIWGIYTNQDTEAPTTPTNVTASNITTFSLDLTWDAATDNVGVSSYDVYINGNLSTSTTNTSIQITDLIPNTNYSFAVLAKDIANNESSLSTPLEIKTLEDTTPPTIPQNVVISNETDISFVVSWDAATDDTSVALYEVYIDDILIGNSTSTTYTVSGLAASTSYKVEVLAEDIVGNQSSLSTPVTATTTNGTGSNANEIFFSEYLEGESNNKALELVNLTNNDINLSSYSIKRQSNGGQNGDDWQGELKLSGTIYAKDVFVIINGKASIQKLIDEKDFEQPNESQTNWGEPINFNGNDPIGLFKNGILIDIIGTYNGGSSNFAKDKNLRRKSGVSQPNTTFDLVNEWDEFDKNDASDFGSHSSIVLSTNDFELQNVSVYPNPSFNGTINIKLDTATTINSISIYSIIGKKVFEKTQNFTNQIKISTLKSGIYLLKINSVDASVTKKIVID